VGPFQRLLYGRRVVIEAGCPRASSYLSTLGRSLAPEVIASSVTDLVETGGHEFDGHPSVRKLISNGYQVLTF
jgi:hypothetical protein